MILHVQYVLIGQFLYLAFRSNEEIWRRPDVGYLYFVVIAVRRSSRRPTIPSPIAHVLETDAPFLLQVTSFSQLHLYLHVFSFCLHAPLQVAHINDILRLHQIMFLWC